MKLMNREGRSEESQNTTEIGTSLKSRIIPNEWKDDIDGILKRELQQANRSFVVKDQALAALIAKQARKDPETFLRELKDRWDWHNHFYEDILEPALPSMLEENISQLSPSQIDAQRIAYEAMSLVDRATLIPTGATKRHLDYWITPEKTPELSDEERRLLITPSV